MKDMIYNSWKERERQEGTRYQNHLINLKRSNLQMRKKLHNSLKFFTSERGAWSEGPSERYWMLSNHENREGMRCKLIENLQFNRHLDASHMRDYSNYSVYLEPIKQQQQIPVDNETTNNLAQKLQLNKQAINEQLNEDLISDDEVDFYFFVNLKIQIK